MLQERPPCECDLFVFVCASVCVGGYMFISVREVKVMENSGSRMWRHVPFHPPYDSKVIESRVGN